MRRVRLGFFALRELHLAKELARPTLAWLNHWPTRQFRHVGGGTQARGPVRHFRGSLAALRLLRGMLEPEHLRRPRQPIVPDHLRCVIWCSFPNHNAVEEHPCWKPSGISGLGGEIPGLGRRRNGGRLGCIRNSKVSKRLGSNDDRTQALPRARTNGRGGPGAYS